MHSYEKLSSPKTQATQTKHLIRPKLIARDIDGIIAWAQSVRNPLRTMASLLFEEDPLISWRAIELGGIVAKAVSQTDMEKVRRHVRKLLWMMNDESGGLCRRGPEAIAEVLTHVPELIPEYAHLLPPYLWEEPFERGTRFALYRLLVSHPETAEIFAGCIGDFLKSLEHSDEVIRGYSLLFLQAYNDNSETPTIAIPECEPCRNVPFYRFDSGVLDTIEITAKREKLS